MKQIQGKSTAQENLGMAEENKDMQLDDEDSDDDDDGSLCASLFDASDDEPYQSKSAGQKRTH